jgi:dynein intermediate chain 1
MREQENINDDILKLTPEELEETLYKCLTSNNPQAAENIVEFSFKDRRFKVDNNVEHLVFHASLDGNILPADSLEFEDQKSYLDNKKKQEKQMLEAMDRELPPVEDDGEGTIITPFDKKKSLRNTFNFQERASQTFNLPIRHKGFKTNPPSLKKFDKETTQWIIFDQYMAQYEENVRLEAEESAKNKKDKKPVQVQQHHVEDPLYSTSMKRALKIMERMIVQNADEEKFCDYKYYEDTTEDKDTSQYGSVLPLWRFSTDKSRKRDVTAIQWNPKYKDLFAVGYGKYNFQDQKTGLICCYTIKNPTFPEYQFSTDSGVMCIDFHPQNPALLAVGLYDGTVMVYDIRLKGNNKPIYHSTVRTNKHTDPVWQIKWNTDDSKSLNFYSISSDGRVTNWTLMKNKLEPEEVIKLRFVNSDNKGLSDNQKEAFMFGLAGGMCFDFN